MRGPVAEHIGELVPCARVVHVLRDERVTALRADP